MTPAEFTAQTVGIDYVDRGMFFSELYLFTTICLKAGVERVIESGVRNGLSTRVLRSLWPDRLQSVELKTGLCPDDVRADLIRGDAREVVPGLIASHGRTPVGVLLDGPKGAAGDALRALCWTYPQVKVIAQHDIASGRGETTHSWDKTFRLEIGAGLDVRVPADVRKLSVNGCPGLGVWVR